MFRKKLCEGSLNNDNSSSDSMNESEEPVGSDCLPSAASDTSSLKSLQKERSSVTEDFSSLNDGRDEIFVPKSSRLSFTQKNKSKFNETILASAAFTAATEPVDVQNEIRWFEGELVPTKPFEALENDDKTLLRNAQTGSDKLTRRLSKESISSTSTIESLPFESKSIESKNTLCEHEKKKKLGHYRSKSDQFRRFRPFGTTKQIHYDGGGNGSSNDIDCLSSTSLPTNSDAAGK